MLRNGAGPGLLRRRRAAVGDGDGKEGDARSNLTPAQFAATVSYADEAAAASPVFCSARIGAI